MEDKKYAVITKAKRQTMWSDSFLCKATIETKDYRIGEIGLLHKKVIEFYSDVENNIKKLSKKDPNNIFEYYIGTRKWDRDEDLIPGYIRDAKNIPVLMYDSANTIRGERKGEDGYFICMLRKGEFEELKSKDIESLLKETKQVCRKNKTRSDENLEDSIKYLECFDILMKNRIHKISIEVARHEITEEERKHQENYLKGMKECDERRARSWNSMHKLVGT